MPYVRFMVEIDCEGNEPGRVISVLSGGIFEHEKDSEGEVSIGHISACLILRGRAMNEGVNLFEAINSIRSSVADCFEALFDFEWNNWSRQVEELYAPGIAALDVLYIEAFELEPPYMDEKIGAKIIREMIATFSSSCGLVVCKPHALKYPIWQDDRKNKPNDPGFKPGRLNDSVRLVRFWADLGFNQLPNSEFYTYAPDLKEQPIVGTKGSIQ